MEVIRSSININENLYTCGEYAYGETVVVATVSENDISKDWTEWNWVGDNSLAIRRLKEVSSQMMMIN